MNPIAFVFALIALVGTIVAGVMFGRSMTQSSVQTSTAALVTQVASNIQSHYQSAGSYAEVSTSNEIANQDIPANDVTPGNNANANTPYGGTLVISGPGSVNGGTNNAFGVTLGGLSKTLCINLATQIASYGVNADTTVGAGANTANQPATDAQAATLCTADVNTLTWTFANGQ